MIVVTISRQLGSGGRAIGRKVADELGIAYVDNEIVSRAAALAGVSEEALADVDERRPTLLSHIAELLARYPTAAELGIPAVEVEPTLSQDTFRRMFEDVILDIGTNSSAVIIGRGGQMILQDKPWVLRVHILAPLSVRIERISQREDVSLEMAEKLARDTDRNRSGYVSAYYKAHWQDPNIYDLMINTGRVDYDTAVNLIVTAARARASHD